MHQTGDVLQARYEVERVLGQGGMGGVYLAMHRGLDARVAVKEMTLSLPDAVEQEAAVRQFRKEAQILHQLRHPNLPRVHDFFDEDGRYYLVMDYIEGQSLEQVVDKRIVSEAEVLGWARELCSVLDYMHHHDPPIIFRDLKPSNIMLAADGHIKLIDFGIAKDFDRATGRGTQTSVRGAGTPGFAAPEQYGQGSDVRTDVYALGATLYSLLTRQVPPDSVDIASGGAELVPLRDMRPDVTVGTARAIERMLIINRTQRPAGMAEVARELDAAPVYRMDTVVRQELIDADPPPVDVRPAGAGRLVGGLLVLAMVLGGWGFLHRPSAAVVAPVSFTLHSHPEQAQVYVDGQDMGTTPVTLSEPLHHSMALRLVKAGYLEKTDTIVAAADLPAIDLTPIVRTLTIEGSPAGAAVKLNGVYAGIIDRGARPFEEAPGMYTVNIHMDGYKDVDTRVSVPPDHDPDLLRFHLTGYAPVLRVIGPPGARITVDGKRYQGDMKNIKAGSHRVRIEADGYGMVDERVAVAAGPPTVVQPAMARLAAVSDPVAVVSVPVPVAAVTNPPAPVASTLIEPGLSLGPIVLGDRAQSLVDYLHMQVVSTDEKGHRHYECPDFQMVSFNGHIWEIGTRRTEFRTAAGIGVGSSRADVVRAYGTDFKPWRIISNEAMHYPAAGLGFGFNGDRVSLVAVMWSPARRPLDPRR